MKVTGILVAASALALAVSACGLGGGGAGVAQGGVTDALIQTPPDEEWLSYGRDYGEQRFSRSEEHMSELQSH